MEIYERNTKTLNQSISNGTGTREYIIHQGLGLPFVGVLEHYDEPVMH